MAYLIFNNNNDLVKIAANDSDRDSQNIVLSDHTVENVSDSDFLKIRTGVLIATYNGTNVTTTEFVVGSESNLQKILNDRIKLLSPFIENNLNNPLYNSLNSYKEYLENFNISSITLPLNKTWEEYCNENSITFYHPLQIP
tara:strand:+ start:729 stop:1151 length:423 start_codon:yes stop_codon:yes gene_type:complete